MKKVLLAFLMLVLVAGISPVSAPASPDASSAPIVLAPRDGRKTVATWYTGAVGACGHELKGHYAASKWYACGSRVKLVHHGKQVVVHIEDRCQCGMDIAPSAFRKLKPTSKGVVKVRMYKRR